MRPELRQSRRQNGDNGKFLQAVAHSDPPHESAQSIGPCPCFIDGDRTSRLQFGKTTVEEFGQAGAAG
jgi:hypothetical protein